MRCLAFQLGEQRYALALTAIVEVLPLLTMRALAQAPDYISGLVNYRGQTVPVLDLCQLALGRASEVRMSTRLLLVRLEAGATTDRLLGLMVERAVDTLDLAPDSVHPSPVDIRETPYLKGLAVQGTELVQLVDVSQLLPDEIARLLYPTESAES